MHVKCFQSKVAHLNKEYSNSTQYGSNNSNDTAIYCAPLLHWFCNLLHRDCTQNWGCLFNHVFVRTTFSLFVELKLNTCCLLCSIMIFLAMSGVVRVLFFRELNIGHIYTKILVKQLEVYFAFWCVYRHHTSEFPVVHTWPLMQH